MTMLVFGFLQSGAWAGHRRRASSSRHGFEPHIASAPRGRGLSTAVAAQRRPFNRNLLDNVDNTIPDGFSNYSSSPYVANGNELPGSSLAGDLPGGVVPTSPQSWQQPEPLAWVDAGGGPDDWPQDPQTPPPPTTLEQQQQPQQQPRVYGEDEYPYFAAQRRPDPDRTPPPQFSSDVPGVASATPSSTTGEAPAAAPQEPRQGQQPVQPPPREVYARPAAGPDWGEIDPLTDWGGVVYGDTSGWDGPYTGDGVAPRPPPSTSMSTSPRDFAGEGEPGDVGAAASGSNRGYGAWGTWGGAATAGGPDRDGAPADWPQAGPGLRSEGSGWTPPYTSYGSWAGTRFSQDERYGTEASSDGAAGTSGAPPSPDAFRPSDIVLLPGPDASSMLPLAPMSTQVDFFQPKTLQERIVQFVGSIGASVILSKAAVLAGPALLYPIWSPWIRAGLRNLDLYSKSFACVGLWRAEVLDVQINGLAIGGMLLSKEPPVVSLLVGDPWVGGARVSLELPYQLRSETIRAGDAVELLVLSRDDRFTSFKVVREVYLPQSGVWLYDYPYVNRDTFVAVSVAVERQRRAEAAAEAEAQYYTYDVAAAAAAPPPDVGPGPDAALGFEIGNGPEAGAGYGAAGGVRTGVEPAMGRGMAFGSGAGTGPGPADSGAAAPFITGDLGSQSSWASGDWK